MFILVGPTNSTEPSFPTCGVKFDAPFLVSARVTETLSNSANSLALPPLAIANSILDVELVANANDQKLNNNFLIHQALLKK